MPIGLLHDLCRLSIGFIWDAYGLSMGCMLIVLSVSMTSLGVFTLSGFCFSQRFSYGSNVCLWLVMRFLCVCVYDFMFKYMCFYELPMNFLGVALLVLCFRCAYGLPMVCLLVRMRFLCCFAISNMRVCVVIPKLFSVCCSCFHMLSVCL